MEDVIRYSTPQPNSKDDYAIFLCAQGVKTLESKLGDMTPQEMEESFNHWYSSVGGMLHPGKTKSEYFLEFQDAHRRVKHPVGGNIIPEAWRRANDEPPPEEAYEYDSPKIQLLISFLWQMQRMHGTEPFFLSCRIVQELLGQETHSTAAKWLGGLCAKGILIEIEKGKKPKASSYRYWKLPT